jgi:tRNA pseudouridine55 synthase
MTEQTQPYNFEEGALLLVDKPVEWTSFDVVNFIRYQIKRNLKINKLKVGHAGTLDPLASGLLVICTGKMTKRIQDFQDQDKVYTGTMQLGMTTPSFDLETEADAHFPIDGVNTGQLEMAKQQFVGEILQIPPVYSAVKIDGKRAFNYARSKKAVKMEPRRVNIFSFELTDISIPVVGFRVHCSKGTYIRSLVHDFGKALQNGACLTSLRRVNSGDFSIENALTIEQIREMITKMVNGAN